MIAWNAFFLIMCLVLNTAIGALLMGKQAQALSSSLSEEHAAALHAAREQGKREVEASMEPVITQVRSLLI